MENIEDKLENYRLRKRRQTKIKRVKDNIKEFFMYGIKDKKELDDKTIVIESDEYLTKDASKLNEPDEVFSGKELSSADELSDMTSCTENLYLQYILRLVYLAFWITLYVIAIELQFGIVFIMFSAIAGIYFNTRTGPKKENEISAYSVFNKNCESIDGTLKAEQFEREMGIK